MSRISAVAICMLLALLAVTAALAQDEDDTVAYARTSGFNVPLLEGWEDQSTDEIAQFHLPAAQATIRTALTQANDPLAGARAELADLVGAALGEPVFAHKVNLADGTWHSLVFDIDADTTASAMARGSDAGIVVISLVESMPEARTLMLTLAQEDDSQAEATPEMALALERLAGTTLGNLDDMGSVNLPSGNWRVFERADLRVMGLTFGNDSYVALQEGAAVELAALADAYNRTLLGFFITPDNSLYLALGLAVSFAILGGLLLSFWWRQRTITQDLALLQALDEDEPGDA